MSDQKNHTTVFPTVTTIKLGTRTYRTGICFGGWFVKEVETGAYLHFYSLDSRNHFLKMIARAAGDSDFDPTPGAPALRLVHTTSVPAVSDSKRDNKVNIPAIQRGEYYDASQPLEDSIAAFVAKYGVEPTTVMVRTGSDPIHSGVNYCASGSVPSGKVYVAYTTAPAKVA